MAPFGDGVGLVARAELRSRWRALLGLVLLVAFVGAVSLAGFAGARRTASALDRFQDATLARDVRVVGTDAEATHQLAQGLEDEPWVATVAEYVHFIANPTPDLGLSIFAGTDDRFSNAVDRPVVLDGRMPRRDAPDEIAVDEVTQELLDIEVGDELTVTTGDADDVECYVSSSCPFQGIPGPTLDLQVVGVARDVDAFTTNDDPTPSATASAAFTEAYRGRIGSLRSEAAVRLEDDEAMAQLEAFMDRADQEGTLIRPGDDFAGSAQDAVDVLGTSLIVFAIVSGLAGAFAIFQAISRQVEAAVAATPALPALGFTRWRRALATALPSAGAVVLGACLAPVGAALASGFFPIGFADRLEPDPGLRIDVPILIGGAVLSGVFISACAFLVARRGCAATRAIKGWAPVWPWATPALAGGARLAFGRGRNRAAGPMRSALVGVAVGTIGVLASATVLQSLDQIVEDPHRWGWNWSATASTLDPELLDLVMETVAEQEEVAAVGFLHEGLVRSDQDEIGAYAFEPEDGEIEGQVRRGRLPTDDDEVAVGEFELERRDLDIGDTYTVTDQDDEELGFEIVGAAVAPPLNDLRPAQGVIFTVDGLDEASIANLTRYALITYEDGVDPEEQSRRFEEIGLSTLSARTPPQLTNLDEAAVVIRALIAFFAALAVVGLVQALALSTRRHRGNLAVWRALGFVPGQVRRAVLWQATLITTLGVAIGVPLGLFVGTVAWRLAIQSVGVLDQAAYPVALIGLALPTAVLATLVLALVPAWLAARGEPADDLHAE